MVPGNLDDDIVWPPGTTTIQAEAAPSGHWMVGIGHWDEAPTVNVVTTESTCPIVQRIKSAFERHTPNNMAYEKGLLSAKLKKHEDMPFLW